MNSNLHKSRRTSPLWRYIPSKLLIYFPPLPQPLLTNSWLRNISELFTLGTACMYKRIAFIVQSHSWIPPCSHFLLLCMTTTLFQGQVYNKDTWKTCFHVTLLQDLYFSLSMPLLTLSKPFRLIFCVSYVGYALTCYWILCSPSSITLFVMNSIGIWGDTHMVLARWA